MSGIVDASLVRSVVNDHCAHIEPLVCPAEYAASVRCWQYDAYAGERHCPYMEWTGPRETRRILPVAMADKAGADGRTQVSCVVMCGLARRNRGAGMWPTFGAPVMRDERP